MSKEISEKHSSQEWERLRKRFFNSILNDTEIAVLGQNVGISWPFKGSDETPNKYIEFDFEELQSVPGLIGKKTRIKNLMDILAETLAFDDPFSDMVDTVEAESAEDDTFERILTKLEIPHDFPSDFIHFSPDTKQLLKTEGIETLIQTIHFGQNLALDATVGVDLKSFLNGLAHTDEASIVKHLPYRRTERNLRLAEAVGLIVCGLEEPVEFELLSQAGVSLNEAEEAIRQGATQQMLDTSLKIAMERFDGLCAWFTKEASDLELICSTSGAVERFFIPINDPRIERVASILARAKFGPSGPDRRGLIGRLSGLFGR